jgi:hypothetical protein
MTYRLNSTRFYGNIGLEINEIEKFLPDRFVEPLDDKANNMIGALTIY